MNKKSGISNCPFILYVLFESFSSNSSSSYRGNDFLDTFAKYLKKYLGLKCFFFWGSHFFFFTPERFFKISKSFCKYFVQIEQISWHFMILEVVWCVFKDEEITKNHRLRNEILKMGDGLFRSHDYKVVVKSYLLSSLKNNNKCSLETIWCIQVESINLFKSS